MRFDFAQRPLPESPVVERSRNYRNWMKQTLTKILPWFTIAFVLLMLGSIHFGWLDMFFFGAEHATVKGIDFFPVPKSYLNLLEGRSVFDTWGGAVYGPGYGTWYLAHPAFSIFVASWFSFFPAWTAYWLFLLFSLSLMALCGYLISRNTTNILNKRIAFAVMLCAFPTYWLLFSGNMHAPLVLALTILLLSLFHFAYSADEKKANRFLMVGLLISFFSKPIVLLMLPLFLLLKETRRTTIKCLFIYGIVSFLFIVVPFLNPQGIGLERLFQIAFDFDFIKENMNIFKNNFVLNEYMKDNSIHWLNLIAQSDYKLIHIDVFSLPVFIDVLRGKETAAVLFKLPIWICLLFSVLVPFIPDKKARLESALLLVMALSLTFFLSYNTVWEYQFTSALPLIALLPLLKEKNVFYSKYVKLMFFTGILFCIPSFYFLIRNGDYNSPLSHTLIHINKVIPAVLLFLIMILALVRIVLKEVPFRKLREVIDKPEVLFFD